MWKYMPCANVVGRSRRSPATPGSTAKRVRRYLNGEQKPGVRARPSPDPFDPLVDYVTARLVEDPHLWARTLFDELEDLGFELSYQSLTRNIRQRNLRRVCEACRSATERPDAVIPHPPGEETQWDWLELPDPPASWGWGKTASLLVGSLAHSGNWRAALSPSTDQPHLVAAIDQVVRGLGGVSGERARPHQDPDHRRTGLARASRRDRRLDRRTGRHSVRQRHRRATPHRSHTPSVNGWRRCGHRRTSTKRPLCQRHPLRMRALFPTFWAGRRYERRPCSAPTKLSPTSATATRHYGRTVHVLPRPDADTINVELPVPCVWVAGRSREDGLSHRSVGRRANHHQRLPRRRSHSAAPRIPHDGYLADFLMRNKGFTRT